MIPREIQKIEDEELKIVWDDGHETRYAFSRLRQLCPCALCRDEWTGRPLINPETVPQDLKASRAELVGNYALAFQFSDGHSTGVYTFDLLRKYCSCSQCVRTP